MAILLCCPNTGLRQTVSEQAVAELIDTVHAQRPPDAQPAWHSLAARLQATLDESRPVLALSTAECRALRSTLASVDGDDELGQLGRAVKQNGDLR